MKLWAKLTRIELQNTVTEIKRFSLESLTLHGGTYRCPQCHAMEIRFMKFMRTDLAQDSLQIYEERGKGDGRPEDLRTSKYRIETRCRSFSVNTGVVE